jgi:hypothetical protein
MPMSIAAAWPRDALVAMSFSFGLPGANLHRAPAIFQRIVPNGLIERADRG